MASMVATMTPSRNDPSRSTESPGNWQHPRLREIKMRQARLVFDESNMGVIFINGAAILLLVWLRSLLVANGLPFRFPILTQDLKTILNWAYTLCFLLPLWHIFVACLPLMRPKDDYSDIALTPGQREILGLPPTNKPPSPGSKICTPPRYSRTPSLSGSPASLASSNLSYRCGSNSGSPVGGEPMAASPLLYKAFRGPKIDGRRSSFGSPSGLGRSSAIDLGENPTTPSPAKRASLGLTNKWLYDKGRRKSSNSWQQQMQLVRQYQES